MRSLVKLVRRYVLAGVGIALGVLILNVVIPFGVIFAVAYRSYFQLPFRWTRPARRARGPSIPRKNGSTALTGR